MTLNPEVVRSACASIEDAVSRLVRFAEMPADQFVADDDAADAASYRLLVGIEAALSLCDHMSATHADQIPKSYATRFNALLAAGVVAPELAVRLQMMARIRNLLIHLDAKIEPARVQQILQDHLDDLRAFADAVTHLIDSPAELRPQL